MIKKFFSILLFTSSGFSMEKTIDEDARMAERLGLLQAEIPLVQKYLSDKKDPWLILGVRKDETHEVYKTSKLSIKDRFPDNFVFLDCVIQTSQNPRFLTVDFNSLEELKDMAEAFRGEFSTITLDHGTIDENKWTKEHLRFLNDMLKLDGQLILIPIPSVDYCYCTEPQCKNIDFESHDSQLIDQIKESSILITDLPVHVRAPNAQKKGYYRDFYYEYVIPYNYVRLFEDVFGQNNVVFDFDKPHYFVNSQGGNENYKIHLIATKK